MSMRIDIVTKNKQLRRIAHDGQVFVQAPNKGKYKLKLYNATPRRQLAVITVDGINVISGKDGNFEDRGYIVGPWQTFEIPGWHRDDDNVAAFTFKDRETGSYAAQMGKGVDNVGVIGVAVFEEAPPKPVITYTHSCRCMHHPCACGWDGTIGAVASPEQYTVYSMNASVSGSSNDPREAVRSFAAVVAPDAPKGPKRRRSRSKKIRSKVKKTADVGTGYGKEMAFQTKSIDFERATTQPAEVLCLRYATKERLQSWGVPIDQAQTQPDPFPNESRGVPAPPGWGGQKRA